MISVNLKFSIYLIAMLCLCSCAAAFIPETDDPESKLEWANAAIFSGRPLPAEKLIKEAITIFELESNTLGLGYAYNVYGGLRYNFPTNGINNGINNGMESIPHYKKSLEYLDTFFSKNENMKNIDQYKEYIQYANNGYYTIGFVNQYNNNYEAACKNYEKSLKYYELQIDHNKNVTIKSPGADSYMDLLNKNKKLSNCE